MLDTHHIERKNCSVRSFKKTDSFKGSAFSFLKLLRQNLPPYMIFIIPWIYSCLLLQVKFPYE